VTTSTLSGNFTTGNSGAGGGIHSNTGGVTLTNSTLSGNSTSGVGSNGGGIHSTAGDISLTSSTFSGNSATGSGSKGGGVHASAGALILTGTLIAGNSDDGTAPDVRAPNAPATKLQVSYSLIGNSTGARLGEANVNLNNLTNVDPLLGPLANNGGPTQTQALGQGSPAIDQGNAIGLDQRGFPRIDNGGIPNAHGGNGADIGAFERPGSVIVSEGGDVTDGDFSEGKLSLREAISKANDNPAINEIVFRSDLTGAVIVLTQGELVISNELTINAASLAQAPTIDAGQNSRVMHFDASDGDLNLTKLTLRNGKTTGGEQGGGGIYFESDGTLSLTDSTVSGNSVGGYESKGGGIYSPSGDISLTNSTLSGNSVHGEYGSGGGIRANSGDMTLTNSTLSGNSATGGYGVGGGIACFGSLTLTNSIIAGNLDNGTAPDLRVLNDPANQLEVSYSLIGNSTGARLDQAMVNLNNLIDLDPFLGPLADNGGDTETMAPLQGSPVINAGIANALTMDQRGFDRIGATDIGAVEYQGPFDLTPAFDSDDDGDGNAYGVEQALGTDPDVSDPANPRNLTVPVFNATGQPMLSFGIAANAAPGTLWILERSTNLGAFVEIYRFDGTTHFDFPGTPINIQSTATGVTITDQAPPAGKAFYRFKTYLAAP
jgi:hypothetical protein